MKRGISIIRKRAVLAASLACAISITACSQDEASADADTKDILTKFALGDTSVLRDGQLEEWYIPDFQSDESIKCPEYLIDGNEVSKEKFEQELKSQILDRQLDASAWTKI